MLLLWVAWHGVILTTANGPIDANQLMFATLISMATAVAVSAIGSNLLANVALGGLLGSIAAMLLGSEGFLVFPIADRLLAHLLALGILLAMVLVSGKLLAWLVGRWIATEHRGDKA